MQQCCWAGGAAAETLFFLRVWSSLTIRSRRLYISLLGYKQAASLLIAMPHAFCYVDLLKDLGSSGRKRRRQAAHVPPEDAALHAANVSLYPVVPS